MKKLLVILLGLFIMSGTNVFAQDIAEENATRIEEIKTLITELELELKELTEDDGEEVDEEKPDGDLIGKTFAHEDVEVVITDIYLTEDRDEYADEEFDNVLVLKYDLKNNTSEEYYAGYDFSVYVGGKKAQEYYTFENKMDYVTSGRVVEIVVSFGFNGEPNDIELELRNYYSYETDPLVIPVGTVEIK